MSEEGKIFIKKMIDAFIIKRKNQQLTTSCDKKDQDGFDLVFLTQTEFVLSLLDLGTT